MKSILSVLIIILVTSCSSLKYSAAKNPDNYTNIKAGNKYTFLQADGSKIPMVITSISKDSIIGTRKNERIFIAKNNITEIRKDKTAIAVVATAGGVAALTTLVVVMVKATDVVADTAAAFGSAAN
jgi:cystathionine beta-lyase/cystathionine gamma-synthase